MKTLATVVTERGQVSIPAEIRKQMNLTSGQRIVWEIDSPTECRIRLQPNRPPIGAAALLGFASTFRASKRTEDWMNELREGESS